MDFTASLFSARGLGLSAIARRAAAGEGWRVSLHCAKIRRMPRHPLLSLLDSLPEIVFDQVVHTESLLQNDFKMNTRFTYWHEEDGTFLGYLNDYPDHWTQGESLADLKEHLRDLYETFARESIPGIRKVEDLELA